MVFASSLTKLLLASTLAFGGSAFSAAIQLRDDEVVTFKPRASTTSALQDFCNNFKATCSDVCLNGKSGSTEIVFACVKNSDGTLGLGCRCDGTDSTRTALAKAAQPDPTATQSATTTETITHKAVSTSTKLVTTKKGTSTVRPTKTVTVTKGSAGAKVVVTVSATSTPVVKKGTLTLTSADETYVYYPFEEYTTTVFTTTSTSYSTAGVYTFSTLSLAERRSVEHAPLQASVDKRDTVSTTFCNAYSTQCTANCKAAGSTVSKETCSKVSSSSAADNYSLLCACKDGSSPTLHALQDVVTGGTTTETTTRTRTKSTSLSTVKTSTRTVPRSTVTKPTSKTVTQTLGKTTSTVTKFIATAPTTTIPRTTTVDTGMPDGYGGNEVFQTYTSTYTETSYATLTISASASTTLNVLAPTGIVRADKSDGNGGTISGYMASDNTFWYPNDYSGYAIPYGLVQLPPDGTGVDSYYLANMRTIGNVVANNHGALTQWTDDSSGLCGGSFAFDTNQIGNFYITQPFRLGDPEPDTINTGEAFDVPLLPHLVTYAQESVSPPVFQSSTGSSLVWGNQPNCDNDNSVVTNHLFFEPLN